MKRILLLATAELAALTTSVNARDDRLPAKFVGDWCLAEHTADHLSFYRRGRCTNPYDREHHRIILHIARIERQYVVVWPREQRSAKTAIMALAIDMALDGLKLQKRRA